MKDSTSSSHGRPGERSHQGPGGSARRPAVCDSSCRIVRSPNAVPDTRLSSRSSRSSRPPSRSRMTCTAVKPLVIEPMRDWVSVVGAAPPAPSTLPRAALHTSAPSRTTPTARDGARPSTWARATRASSARAVSGRTTASSGLTPVLPSRSNTRSDRRDRGRQPARRTLRDLHGALVCLRGAPHEDDAAAYWPTTDQLTSVTDPMAGYT